MATKKKAPVIKAAKKVAQKKTIKVEEQPDETDKLYEDEEEFIEPLQEEPSIADILKRNKKQ